MQEEIQPSAEAIMAVALTAPVHPLTGADVDALAPLFQLIVGREQTPVQIIAGMPPALTALSQVLSLDRAALASLPLHQLLAIFEATLPRWIEANSGYFTETLAPAVESISASMRTLYAQVSAATSQDQ